jgi:hypothetical protein
VEELGDLVGQLGAGERGLIDPARREEVLPLELLHQGVLGVEAAGRPRQAVAPTLEGAREGGLPHGLREVRAPGHGDHLRPRVRIASKKERVRSRAKRRARTALSS